MKLQLFKDIDIIYQYGDDDTRLSFYDVIQLLWKDNAEIVQWDGSTIVIKKKESEEQS